MALPFQTNAQRDFSAGEVDPNAIRRDDLDEFKNGVRYARDLALNDADGLTRRAGREFLYRDTGRRDEFRPTSGTRFLISFKAGFCDIRRTDGILVDSIAAPWTADDVENLTWEPINNEVFIAWGGRPKVLVYDALTATFDLVDFVFDESGDGAVDAPFYRFAERGVTITPSAATGSVTLTFSFAYAKPEMIGIYLRYVEKQILVTGYTSPTVLTGTVLDELPPTYRINVGSTAGFEIGDVLISDVTATEAVIVAINSGTQMEILITKNYSTLTNGEYVVGPNSKSKISSTPSSISPGATTLWDEIFISDFRGWPRSVSQDVQRLIFCDFPQFQQAIIWSAIDAPKSFLVTGDPVGAIFEYIPRQCRVYHVIGGYDEFAFTDAGVFYIPISSANPLQPGSVEFREIITISCLRVRPIRITEAVIFADVTNKRIHAITATGQTARPYVSAEITKYHHHLFTGIREISAINSADDNYGRLVFVIDNDGGVITGKYTQGKDYVGWMRWGGQGLVQSVATRYDDVIFTTIYNGISVAEKIDDNALFDASIALGNPDGFDSIQTSTGDFIILDDGDDIELNTYKLADFAGGVFDILADGLFYESVQVGLQGQISINVDASEIIVGKNFTPKIRPLFKQFEGGERYGQRARRRKISKILLRVLETQQFNIGKRQFGSYRQGENMDIPVVKRDEVYRYKVIGRSWDPDILIEQPIPGSFTLAELLAEVTV